MTCFPKVDRTAASFHVCSNLAAADDSERVSPLGVCFIPRPSEKHRYCSGAKGLTPAIRIWGLGYSLTIPGGDGRGVMRVKGTMMNRGLSARPEHTTRPGRGIHFCGIWTTYII